MLSEGDPRLTDSGWHPQILFRLWPRINIEGAFDDWQRTTHGAQLVEAPGAVLFGYFESIVNLPQAYRSGVSRMDYYTARDVPDLFAWMSSDELSEGLSDADRWLSGLNEVDRQAFSANVYVATTVAGHDPAVELPLFVERFEVPQSDAMEFDNWLRDEHGPEIAQHPGVERVRTFEAIRDNVPIEQYRSVGNRMLRADLAPEDVRSTLMSPPLMAALADSMRWDRRLSYVTRDVFSPLFGYKASHADAGVRLP